VSTHRPLVISANSCWNLLNFCRGQIHGLQEAGYSVAAVAPLDQAADALARLGVSVHHVHMREHGLSPLADLRLCIEYYSLLRRIQPLAYLGITAKPNIYGSIAAQLAGIPVINSVTGLGTAFLGGPALELLVSTLYRAAFLRSKKVFFLNRDDRDLLVARHVVRPDRATVVPGSGIDLQYFGEAPPVENDRTKFLYIGRMLSDKGVREFLEAAQLIRRQVAGTQFQLLGPREAHPKAVPPELLRSCEDDGTVEFFGSTSDVRPYIAASDCVVLPSYREGLPRVLVEAGAMARPVIASDVPGCRDVVEDGITGYLCDAKSAESLAAAMLKFVRRPREERWRMGKAGRRKVEREFCDSRVVAAYVQALDAILGDRLQPPPAPTSAII